MPERTFQQAFAEWQFGIYPWFQKEEDIKFSPATPEQLQSLGVNTAEIDSQIESDIATSQANIKTQEQFQKSFDNAKNSWKFTGLSDDEIMDWLLNSYKSKWYSIEWIDIDEELWIIPEIEEEIIEEEPWVFKEIVEAPWRLVWAGIAKAPEIVWDVAGFLLWKPVDFLVEKAWFDKPSLEEQFKKDWLESKATLQEILWVDPDDFTTTAWELGAEFGSLFLPWGQTKLVAKFPALTDKIKTIWTAIEKFWEKSPNVYKVFKSALTWAKEAGKFEIVSEWELEEETLTFWAVAWWFFNIIGQAIKLWDPAALLRKITWLKPTQIKKLWTTTVQKDSEIVVDSLKKMWVQPKTRLELFDTLSKRQQEIYTKHINPILTKASEWWKVQLTWITDDILNKIDPKIAWKRAWWWIGQTKETEEAFEGLIKYWKGRETQKLTFQEIEDLKRIVATELRDWSPKWLNKAFLSEINTRLWNQLDDLLESVWGAWVK